MDLDNKIISIPFKDIRVNKDNSNIPTIPPSSGGNNSGDSSSGNDDEFWEDMEDLVSVLTLSVSEGTWEDMDDPDNPIEPEPEPEPEPTPPIDPIIPEGKEEEIGIKEGDIITWKEIGSHWLIYLRRLEETAYFRGDMRRCRHQITLGNGSQYWVYVRGPIEKAISWQEESNNYFNKLNYTLLLYLPNNEETEKYFNRFKKIMINNKPWEVQSVDTISTPGIIELYLKETFTNTIETNIEEAVRKAEQKEDFPQQEGIYIKGPNKVYPYDVHIYTLENYNGIEGKWVIKNESRKNSVKMLPLNNTVELHIKTGKSGSFVLAYETTNGSVAALDIVIGSL
jgi:hypothetical protein